MKKELNFFLALITFCALSITLNAQIRYSNGNLNINNASQNFSWGLFVNDWPTLYWTCNNNNFLLLDVSPTNPRISGTGNQIAFFNTITKAYNSIQVANVYNYSDARAKSNVQTLTSGLSKILRLRPVTYNWKQINMFDADVAVKSDSTGNTVSTGPTDDKHIQYGFLAQEVETIMPDVVKTDEGGNKLVNYTALIPVLVQAIQDLQSTIEEQAQKIEQLTRTSSGFLSNSSSTNKIISCSPNPTNGYVTISTKLDTGVQNATLTITSMSGTREKTLSLSSDFPTVSEDISSLDSGIYVVSLYVDGILCSSTRLIKE